MLLRLQRIEMNMPTLWKSRGAWSCKMHTIDLLSPGGSCHLGERWLKSQLPLSHINHGHCGRHHHHNRNHLGYNHQHCFHHHCHSRHYHYHGAVIGTIRSIIIAIANVAPWVLKSHTPAPGRRQAIIWTSAAIWSIGPSWTNFSEILVEIQAFHSRKCI